MSVYIPEQYAAEFDSCTRRAAWELRNIIRALSFHPHLNTAEESARLAAAKAVLTLRARAAKRR